GGRARRPVSAREFPARAARAGWCGDRSSASRPRPHDSSGAGRRIAPVVLSDRTIQRLLDEGRIEIDPYDAALLQPSSVDVRVDRFFRVFRNSRYPYIDVKQEQEDLTELVEI